MKKIKLAGMAVSTIVLVQLAIFFGSCQKENSFSKETAVAEFATQSVNANANALPHTKQFPADVATTWFKQLCEVSRTKPYNTSQSLRIFAYSSISLYESVAPGMPSYQSIYKYITGNTIEVDKKKDYYWPACANAALARILTRIMQSYPAPNLTTIQALETSFNTSFQSQITAEQLQFSNEFGRYVADIIYEWSKTDGTFNPDGTLAACAPYVPLGGPGNWVPTPPGFFPAVGQCTGGFRTFIPNIVNTNITTPHPVYSTDPASAFYQSANEVYQRRNNITQGEMKSFSNWRDLSPNHNPISHMVRLSTDIFIKENLNLEDASVLYAKQSMAAFDAASTAFKSKFQYSLIRPITFIRNVMGYGTWLSFGTTPQTPSYPDELSVTAASIAVLEHFVGTTYSLTDSVHQSTHGVFFYPSLDAIVLDIIEARVAGGTSFRFGGTAGAMQGRQVGELINTLPFKKP